jgi:hypothetical protein
MTQSEFGRGLDARLGEMERDRGVLSNFHKQPPASVGDRSVSDNQGHYWACSVCDSGGHPLGADQAFDSAQAHLERSGHFVIHGMIDRPATA